jgi:hypothetical protein
MDIVSGFQLEHPRILLRWDITERELEETFQGQDLRRIGSDGYHLPRCKSLGGLSHSLGVSFDRTKGRLSEIALAIRDVPIEVSYDEFQRHLEAAFGPSEITSVGTEGFPNHTWLLKGGKIEHYVIEHFGPAENVKITPSELAY